MEKNKKKKKRFSKTATDWSTFLGTTIALANRPMWDLATLSDFSAATREFFWCGRAVCVQTSAFEDATAAECGRSWGLHGCIEILLFFPGSMIDTDRVTERWLHVHGSYYYDPLYRLISSWEAGGTFVLNTNWWFLSSQPARHPRITVYSWDKFPL